MSKKENQNNKNYNIEKGEVLVGSSLLKKKIFLMTEFHTC